KSKILENRDIVLYPDAGCYDKWYKKMQQIRSEIYCRITISKLIEIHATPKQKEAGYDLADYIIQQLKAENNLPQPRSAHNTQPRTQTPPKPQSAPSAPFSPTLQRMINLNPSLLTLINEFQLVECR
ncbi:MAG: hypothetical protein VB090_10085, partial [Petrimonas sp.]|nr:hypothetical protein [Petrimonas sp.]